MIVFKVKLKVTIKTNIFILSIAPKEVMLVVPQHVVVHLLYCTEGDFIPSILRTYYKFDELLNEKET